MGSRLSDSEALAERCRKAGWQVVRNTANGSYKVWTPDGKWKPIHLTYSDRNSLKRCTAELEDAGLKEAEEAIRNARLTESRGRAQVAAEAARERGLKLAASASITRAAGPYLTEPETVELAWFTKAHPSPWMRWAYVDASIADYLLKNCNDDNRDIDQTSVLWYRDIILSGQWKLTHQGLAFDTRGTVQDAQHRLMAICEAQKLSDEQIRVPFAVFVGMPVENFQAIDEGRLRTARQLFGKAGEKNLSALHTCVRLVYYHQDQNARSAARTRLPNAVILARFGDDPDDYRDSASFGQANCRKVWTGPGTLAAAHYLIYKVNGRDNDFVRQFFEGLIGGNIPGTRLMLDDDDPRRAYRQRMADRAFKKANPVGGKKAETLSGLTQLGMILTTWNNTVKTRKIRNLYFNELTEIPQALRCIPGEGALPSFFTAPASITQAAG